MQNSKAFLGGFKTSSFGNSYPSGVIKVSHRRGVCLIRFDDKKGPGCLFSEGLDRDFAEKVSMKSHLSTLSLTSNIEIQREEFIESVIPFLDENYVAFSTFFFVDDKTARGGKRTVGIVALVDKSEQITLYKSIPEISSNIRKIASELLDIGDPKENLTDNIITELKELIDLENLIGEPIDSMHSTELIKNRLEQQRIPQNIIDQRIESESLQKKSLEFLTNTISTCLDRVIHALIKNEKILVIGTKEEINLTIIALKEFIPYKKTYNNLWTVPLLDAEALFSKTSTNTRLHVLGILEETFYDIINIDSNQFTRLDGDSCSNEEFYNSEKLPIESSVIIDFKQRKVFGGMPNYFCKDIVNLVSQSNDKKIIKQVESKINYLLDRINQLTDLFYSEEPEKIEITIFIDNAAEGEIPLIVSIIEDTNPILLEKIIDYFTKYELALEILF